MQLKAYQALRNDSKLETIVASAVAALGKLDELEMEAVLPALQRVKRRFPSLERTVADTLTEIAMVA
ncbi:hypothetical protein E3Z29_14085 [Pseudomonas sp. S150]|nr:hypothetical protein E3Z29_14085 [Pseudomonas sp. S150]